MSQQAAARGHPTTFNTNVNRAKTKKWVEAKSYSYDGDDWGDVDDYDEYGDYDEHGGYDEPGSASEPKPTEVRQRGQSASQLPQDPYSARRDPYQSPVDSRIHGPGQQQQQQQQQQYGSRSVTNPQPQPSGMRRMNSFDPEDERRAFSAGGPPQNKGNTGLGAQPPFQPVQGQNIAAQDFQSGQDYRHQQPQSQQSPARPSVQIPSRPSVDQAAGYGDQPQEQAMNYQNMYPDQSRYSSTGGRTESMASTNSALDFHNRRDFSPSALPPPLQTRGSPSPHSRSSLNHPPRKSSMSQETAPAPNLGTQRPIVPGAGDADVDRASTRERATSGANNALPFVRPVDIYKRMQEEKEKERQSQDSTRPSMDTLIGKPKERPDLGNPQNKEANQQLKSTLDPVSERRSEYGSEGVTLNEQPKPEERRPTTSKTFELPKRKSNGGTQGISTSIQPLLPDVNRVSGFGESFFGPIGDHQEPSQENPASFTERNASAPEQKEQDGAIPDKDLKNQPSLGFTSAVHEAFDRAEDQVPPTPSSAAGSTVGRSTSGGTSAVSPIISRGPSTSTENWSSKLPGIDDVTTPTRIDEHEGRISRPMSSSSQSTPKETTKKPSLPPAAVPQSVDLPTPSFIPGHRRDLSTPSPDNSPAKTPALEVNRHLRQPQEVELAATTPTDPSFRGNSGSKESDVSEQGPVPTQLSEVEPRGRSDLHVDTQNTAKEFPRKADPASSPVRYPQSYLRTRTDSGSSSRVRDLADKFESGSRPESAHSATPRSSAIGNIVQRDDLVPPRPLVDRMESFRPHLPGGWESSASIAPAAALRRPESTTNRPEPDSIAMNDEQREGPGSSADGALLSTSQIKDASADAFSAVAAAGNALADAFTAAVGIEQRNEPEADAAPTPFDESMDKREPQGFQAATQKNSNSMNTIVNPEATISYPPESLEDEASTAAPTPLPKDTHFHPSDDSKGPDYFSSPQNQSPPSGVGLREGSPAANRPSALPSLSTNTKTPQYESDRLRREIVRELSPMNASEPSTAQSDYSNYNDASKLSTNQSIPRPGYESVILPREYESYWNDANSDDDKSHLSGEPGELEDATTARRQQGATVVGEPLRPRHVEQEIYAGESQHADPEQQAVHSGPPSRSGGSQDSPQVLQHRFSWEQPLQSPQPIFNDPNTIHEVPYAPVSNFAKSSDSQEVRKGPDTPMSDFLRAAVYPEGKVFEPKDRPETPQLSTLPKAEAARGAGDSRLLDQDLSVPRSQIDSGQHSEAAGIDQELVRHEHVADLAPSSLQEDHVRQMDLGNEGGTIHAGQQSPISQVEQRRDVEVPLIDHSVPKPAAQEVTPPFGAQTNEIPPLPPSNVQPKIAAFREILSLKSPSERIRSYDETREQFAEMNTGLAHWLAITASELPEHADLFTDSARRPAFQGHKPSPSRSMLGGLLQSNTGHSNQSYSNSSPSVPTGGLSSASPYGYSPSTGSSSKISSQQVQAKGKDLLHSAGVFGGKANVAAKGLISKGKSKLRGSSNVEKALPAPPLPHNYNPESRGMQQQPRNIEEQPTLQSAGGVTTSSKLQHFQRLRADTDKTATHPPISPERNFFANVDNGGSAQVAKEPSYPPANPNEAAVQTPSQESEPLPQSVVQRSPRDTPSLHSFSQSQEGDDERSEESALENQENPPRASSLYLKGIANFRRNQSSQTSGTLGDTAPSSIKEKILEDPLVGSPKEVHTPRSAASSNQTPTQATFTDPSQSAMPGGSADKIGGVKIRHRRGTGSSPRSFSQQQSEDTAPILSRNQQSQEPESAPGFSHDSETTRTATSGDGQSRISPSQTQNSRDQQANASPYSQNSDEKKSPHQPESPQGNFPRYPANVKDGRPVSLIYDPTNLRAPSQDYSRRVPSIDSDSGRVNFDHPPSPLTPRQPTNPSASEPRGRTGPTHYGINHDFDRPSDTERSRSRSPSYSERLRRSQDSRPSLDPNILDHPAFRAVAKGNGMPAEDYHAHFTREEKSSPRQQTAEEMLVGGGPTLRRRSESKSRSRRGSRSSAFFKAFTSPSKSEHPPMPQAPESQSSSSPRSSPAVGDRKSKRLSIFRPRSVNMGSGSGDSYGKDNMASWSASNQDFYTQAPNQVNPVNPTKSNRVVEEETTSKVSSKLSKKPQRASTSTKPEAESGKKKRFSAIGTLFGGRNRQNSTPRSEVLSHQSHPTQTQQRDLQNISQPKSLEQHGYGPRQEEYSQPPREGYYAPGRRSPISGSRQHGQSYSRAPDASAYVQDSAYRVHQLMSPVEPSQNMGVLRSSATFPQRNPQDSSPSVPRSSTFNQTRAGEAFPRHSDDQSKASGSPWTRFSAHARSKSRQNQARPPSNGVLSSPPPNPYPPAAPFNTPANATNRRSFQGQVHAVTPSPPPPPPKDNWHRPRPRDSSSLSPPQTDQHATHHHHSPTPSQSSTRSPPSTQKQQRQSLPPLQTNVPNHGKNTGAIDPGRMLTPEEKRKSRRMEIERASIPPPQSPRGNRAAPPAYQGREVMEERKEEEEEEDEEPVMSATSFPGQMWQPSYAHWGE